MKILTKEYIKNNLYNSIGNLNIHKLKNILIPKEYSWCETKAEYIYCILNDIKEQLLCKECNNPVKYNTHIKKYNEFCSPSCSSKNKFIKEKSKKTKKLNNKKIFHPNIIDKKYIKGNLLNKTGSIKTEKILNLKIPKQYSWCKTKNEYIYCILNDIKKQPLCKECNNSVKFIIDKKYYNKYCSPSCSSNSKEVKEKTIKTNLLKYNSNYYLQNKENYEEFKNNNLLKHGFKYTFQLPEVIEKRKNTNLKIYGVKNVFQNHNIKEKIKNKLKEKYGVENSNYINTKHYLEYKDFLKNHQIFLEFWLDKEKFFKIYEFMEYFNLDWNTVQKMKKNLNFFDIPNKMKRNKTQKEIYKYLNIKNKTFNNNQILSFNKFDEINKYKEQKLELDIYLPNFKIAIEYNGLMFHSFGMNKYSMFNNYNTEKKEIGLFNNKIYYGKDKHLLKTELCEEKNIQLFHIFENEWLNEKKQEIWKSMLNYKINAIKNSNKVYARNCIIKDLNKELIISNKNKNKKSLTRKEQILNNKIIRKFEDENHLQGNSISSIKLGIFSKKKPNELLGLMTFGKSRFSKDYEYELIRFCVLKEYSIVGGASKLLKYFEKNYKPKSLVTYANKRWSTGDLYNKLGFIFKHNSKPNYFYFNENNISILYSRNKFQKHKIKEKFNNNQLKYFNNEESETINMYKNGYRKIYDSGNMVYFKTY